MIKKIAIGIAAALALFFIFVAFKPAEYTISRSVTIHAPAEKIFPYLNSTKLCDLWHPWKEYDPKVVMSFSGPEAGVGSKASWDSPGSMGSGSATVMSSTPNSLVGIKLEYTKPMKMVQDAAYSIDGAGAAGVVTWKVQGQNNFIGRLMCVFMNMDKMVGDMFEKGLANLKVIAERP